MANKNIVVLDPVPVEGVENVMNEFMDKNPNYNLFDILGPMMAEAQGLDIGRKIMVLYQPVFMKNQEDVIGTN